jgi:hypothetical protein
MKTNLFLLTIFFSLSFVSQSQDMDALDTMKVNVKSFIHSVAKIELIQLLPYCSQETRFIDSLNQKKVIEKCYAESIIFCEEIMNDSTCKIDESHIGKRVQLSTDKNDSDSLFKVLYESKRVEFMTICFMPRHGVLLYDQQNKLLGLIEICFECNRILSTVNIPEIGLISDDAFVALKKLFDKYGL